MTERAGRHPESVLAGPEPHAFGARLQHALDGLAVRGRLHVVAWEPDAADRPLLIRADEVVTAASTIKVPILAAALGEVDAAARSRTAERHPAPADGRLWRPASLARPARLTLADLLTLMIIVSDNTATNVVIDLIGMERVNQFCAGAGLNGTVLRRKMMDADAVRLGLENTTTAHDQAKLLGAIAWRNLFLPRCAPSPFKRWSDSSSTMGCHRYCRTRSSSPTRRASFRGSGMTSASSPGRMADRRSSRFS